MAKSATAQLSEHIDAIRREAFAMGYAAAMQAIRKATSTPVPGVVVPRVAKPVTKRGRVAAAATQQPARQPRKPRRAGGPATPRVSRPGRGSNARLIEEMLKSIAPRAARPAEIRSTLQSEKGVAVAFTSIRHALGQLEARRVVEQVPDSKTWRHLG